LPSPHAPLTSIQTAQNEGVKDRPGLAHHGDVQPADRSDAWSRRPDRWAFDAALLQAIERHAGIAPVAPPTPTQPVPVAPETMWRVGSTGDKVREIQKIVGVNQDGIYGPQTERAVIQWQKNLRITPDGIWGPGTEQATHDLFVFLANLPAVQETSPDNPFFAAPATDRAVRRFQSDNGLAADGIVGPQTWSALLR